MIVDAHVHLPVESGCVSLQQKKERLLHEMAANRVDKCIVISDSCPQSVIGNMDECVELFKDTNQVDVVGGISPFFEFETQLEKIRNYLDQKLIVGIKLFTGHEAFYLTDERLKKVYGLAIRYHVPVLFHSGGSAMQYSDAALVSELAKEYPELKLVCCHCFYPKIEKCRALVNLKNVFFDLSSIADDTQNRLNILKMIREMADIVPERVLFGSDYACCGQRAHIEFVKELHLEKRTESLIFERNEKRVYLL